MSFENLLHIFILIPVLGLILSVIVPKKNETLISGAAYFTVGLHLLLIAPFTAYWLFSEHPPVNLKDLVIYQNSDYQFYIDFYFDKVTATYMLVGAILTFLVTVYSKRYLHREEGYKRFYGAMQLFYVGYNLVVFSGNLETLFIGWEILGICSFLLIAFYRDRFIPVKNALKVFTIYRIGDVGLILAMWATHHLWNANITFEQLNNQELVHERLQSHTLVGVFISLAILAAAAAKSAQLPFSSWVPRAMEGPTPSSAIFYGSLSIHIGVFLLMRTYPFWENQTSVRIFIGVLGILTSWVCGLIARVQSSVKGQIAYASASQIGLMFVELALGFENLALIHFAGNAFLRTYQLLISPSTVSYLIREQFYNFTPREKTFEKSFPQKLENTFYMLSLKEWNLDSFIAYFIWNPMKNTGRKFQFFTLKSLLIFFIPTYIIGLVCLFTKAHLPDYIHHYLPATFSLIGLAMVLKAFAERKNVYKSWLLIIMNHFWIALAISFNEKFGYEEVYVYLSGVVLTGLIGFLCLRRISILERGIDLRHYFGHVYEHPVITTVFLIACIGLTGFPITPTFIGEDLIFSHIHQNQIMLAVFTSLSFVIDGLALVRIFARVFLGPHIKTYHETPYRSS